LGGAAAVVVVADHVLELDEDCGDYVDELGQLLGGHQLFDLDLFEEGADGGGLLEHVLEMQEFSVEAGGHVEPVLVLEDLD
jgi:hypothetical protein